MKTPFIAVAASLIGCVFLPQTTSVYNADCHVQEQHMTLELQQIASFGRCANQGCAALLVAAGAVTASSAVVSGSIVVGGNVVYWLERRGNCAR